MAESGLTGSKGSAATPAHRGMRLNPVNFPFFRTETLRYRVWDRASAELCRLEDNPDGFERAALPFHVICMNVGSRPTPFEVRTDRRHRRTYRHGDHMILPVGTAPAYAWEGVTRCLTLRVEDEVLRDYAEACGPAFLAEGHALRDDRLEQLMRLLAADLRGEGVNRLYGEALVQAIVAAAIEADRGPRSRPRGGLTMAQARRLAELIDARLGDDLSLDALAREAGLSRFHFARCFRTAFGEAPHAYLTRRRIERAKAMLATGARPVTEIALDLGFSSHSHFSATFHRAVGISPSEFRRASRM
ncbi:helix-turn-helix transcriptional regulator [Roseomonas sp. CCTCC AB2023176]|uniref:helix-turn-helix transcriptional regulator n=1 Tax=Roseomonas sp. CCTCC AB2023176 TaxID=3342640 RepID=UPI0035D9B171